MQNYLQEKGSRENTVIGNIPEKSKDTLARRAEHICFLFMKSVTHTHTYTHVICIPLNADFWTDLKHWSIINNLCPKSIMTGTLNTGSFHWSCTCEICIQAYWMTQWMTALKDNSLLIFLNWQTLKWPQISLSSSVVLKTVNRILKSTPFMCFQKVGESGFSIKVEIENHCNMR